MSYCFQYGFSRGTGTRPELSTARRWRIASTPGLPCHLPARVSQSKCILLRILSNSHLHFHNWAALALNKRQTAWFSLYRTPSKQTLHFSLLTTFQLVLRFNFGNRDPYIQLLFWNGYGEKLLIVNKLCTKTNLK